MAESSVQLTGGIPETVLPDEPPDVTTGLASAEAMGGADRRAAVAAVVAAHPTSLFAWARLGELARDDVEAYACFRVGYHRGLDALRRAGWGGTRYVRWQHPSNRGFLAALDGLARTAAAIGEADEAERCEVFLRQLDPSWPPTGRA